MKPQTSRKFLDKLIARRQSRLLFAASLLTGGLALGGIARADDINGSGYNGLYSGGNWSDTRNWDSTAPSNGERNLFFGNAFVTAGSTGTATSNNDLTNYIGYRINFENNASAPSFVLNGNALTLADFGGNAPAIINSAARLETINLGVTFSSSTGAALIQTGTTGGSLLFGGAVTVNAGTQLQISGAAGTTTTFNGVVGGGGTVVASQGTSAMTVVYGATNTYTGDTFIDSGTLQFGSATSATGTADSSTLRLGTTSGTANATISLATTAGGQTIGSVINPRTGNTGTLSLNAANTSGTDTLSNHIGMDKAFTITEAAGTGTLAITQARANSTDTGTGTDIKGFTLTLTAGAGSTISYTGDIYNSTGSGSIATTGNAGTIVLGGNNTFGGATTLAGGTLRVTNQNGLGANTTAAALTQNSSTTLVFANDGTGNNGTIAYGPASGTTLQNITLNLGGNSGTLTVQNNQTTGGNTGNTISLGQLSYTNSGNYSINTVNGYKASFSSLVVNASGSGSSAAILGSAPVTVTGTSTLNLASSSRALTYSGTGSLTLSGNFVAANENGANLGSLSVSNGTLNVNGTANSFTGGLTIGTSGLYNAGNLTAFGTSGNTGTITVSGNGSLDNTSGGALSIANPINMSGGSLTFVGTNNLTTTGGVTLTAGNRTLTVNANTLTTGGIGTDATLTRTFTKQGAGTLVINGASTYTGSTTIGGSAGTPGGTLVEGASNALANSALTMGSNGNSKLVLGTATSGAISQGFTYGATTTVSTGNTTTNSIVGGNASNSTLTFSVGSGFIATNDELIGGSGTNENNLAVTITGAGTTRFQGQAETYNGDTTVNSGATLSINFANALPYGTGKGNLVSNGNTDITIASSSLNVNGLSGSGQVRSVSSTTKTLVVGNNNATSQFDGTLTQSSGALALTKTGTGTLTLTGTNSYSGVTSVNGGSLFVNGTNSGTGTVTVSGTGTVLGGSGSIAGATTINSGAQLLPGGAVGGASLSANIASLKFGSTLGLNGTFMVDLSPAAGTTQTAGTNYDQVVTTGALTLSNTTSLLAFGTVNNTNLAVGQVFLIALDGGPGAPGVFSNAAAGSTVTDGNGDTFTISYTATGDSTAGNDISLTVSGIGAVPEPATYLGGLLLVGALGWRQRGALRGRLAKAA